MKKTNQLALAIAMILGAGSFAVNAAAPVPKGVFTGPGNSDDPEGNDPILFASEIKAGGKQVNSHEGGAQFGFDLGNEFEMGGLVGNSAVVKFTLQDGATFNTDKITLQCFAITGTTAHGMAGTVKQTGGVTGSKSVVFRLDASGNTDFTAFQYCVLTASAVAAGQGVIKMADSATKIGLSVSVDITALAVSAPNITTAGVVWDSKQGYKITANWWWNETAGVLDVSSGYMAFDTDYTNNGWSGGNLNNTISTFWMLVENTDNDSRFGVVTGNQVTAVTLTATELFTSASVSMDGPTVLSVVKDTNPGADVWLVVSGNWSCTSTQNYTAGTVTNSGFTFSNVAVTAVAGGFGACLRTSGLSRVEAGKITVSVTPSSDKYAMAGINDLYTNVVLREGSTKTAWNIPSPDGIEKAYIRLHNWSNIPGNIYATVIAQDGSILCEGAQVVSNLAPGATAVLSPEGWAAAGCPGRWTGRAKAVFDADFTNLQLQALLRTAVGTLEQFSNVAAPELMLMGDMDMMKLF